MILYYYRIILLIFYNYDIVLQWLNKLSLKGKRQKNGDFQSIDSFLTFMK